MKKELMTMNTTIERGEVKFNSPTSYSIKNRENNEEILKINIQKGPVKENDINGIFIEDLLLIAIDQIEHFQNSEFNCKENETTLINLYNALNSTRARQYDRILRGVQGRNVK